MFLLGEDEVALKALSQLATGFRSGGRRIADLAPIRK
jgi:hypothetical protein